MAKRSRREFLENAAQLGAATFLVSSGEAQAEPSLKGSSVPGAPHAVRPAIWGERIMKQPFDTKPFREVEIPAWLEEITLHTFGGPEDSGKYGAQLGELGFGDTEAVIYPSKLLKRRPSLPEGYVAEQVALFRKAGMRIIGAIPPAFQGQMYYAHPEWRAIFTNTTVIPTLDPVKQPGGGVLCQMGPWGDFLIDVLAEVLTLYPDVDGFGFDGIHHYQVCYCQFCRAAYRKETGQEIPDVNMNDLAYRRYLHWFDRRMEGFVEKMQTRLKGIKPDFAIVSWTTNAGRFGHFRDIPRNMSARMNLLFDAPMQEFWLDETNRGNTVVPAFANAYLWAVTNHRTCFSEPYMMSHGNPYGTYSFPAQEMLRRGLLAPAHGAQTAISLGWPGMKEAAGDLLHELKRRSPWLTHKEPEPWAALVMSDNTRTFYGREPGQVEERYMSHVLGTFRAALEEHLPVTVINDWNLNAKDLAPYKVLILADTACLSDEQAEAIRAFVRSGGGLVASVDASLCDELGERRKDFALADVFGVRYQGVPRTDAGKKEALDVNFAKGVDAGYWDKRKNVFLFAKSQHPLLDLPRLQTYLGPAPIVVKGPAVIVGGLSPDAQPLGKLTNYPDGGVEIGPAGVARTYGKGKVVYLAAGFDAGYYLYPFPYQRLLTAQAVRWAASEPAPVTVTAPMCVHSNVFRQKKNGERLVVHLYNDLNSAGNHAKPDDDVPLREEIIPLHDIQVDFRGYRIARLHLEPEGIDLPPRPTADGVQVTVPTLAIHSMVVAELAG